MSFQQRLVGKRKMLCIRCSQSMGGGTKQKNLNDTASESIDSCQRIALRRNDMLSALLLNNKLHRLLPATTMFDSQQIKPFSEVMKRKLILLRTLVKSGCFTLH